MRIVVGSACGTMTGPASGSCRVGYFNQRLFGTCRTFRAMCASGAGVYLFILSRFAQAAVLSRGGGSGGVLGHLGTGC